MVRKQDNSETIPTSAHFDARYMLLMVPNLTINMHPYDRLIKAHISDSKAAVLVTGSSSALGIWNIVKIALPTD